MFDLRPPARQLQDLVASVRDDQLDSPTPCADWTVAQLLAHVHQFATVFTLNARKEPVERPDGLPEEWRVAVPAQIGALAEAWRAESAWSGRLTAGGVEMDAEDNAVVAFEELVVHGWDLSRATGQEFAAEAPWLDQLDRFLELFAGPIGSGQGPYGPEVPAPDDASRLERAIARTGRDPQWSGPR